MLTSDDLADIAATFDLMPAKPRFPSPGSQEFEDMRATLASLEDGAISEVSDAEVIAFFGPSWRPTPIPI